MRQGAASDAFLLWTHSAQHSVTATYVVEVHLMTYKLPICFQHSHCSLFVLGRVYEKFFAGSSSSICCGSGTMHVCQLGLSTSMQQPLNHEVTDKKDIEKFCHAPSSHAVQSSAPCLS
jgi:hypothetical protein